MRQQTLIWTALPKGRTYSGDLALSVFLAPRLATDEAVDSHGVPVQALLSLFPDFVSWPDTLAAGSGISFSVSFGSQPAVPAQIVGPDLPLDALRWQALFQADTTGVDPFTVTDYSSAPKHSFGVMAAQQQVASTYQAFGVSTPSVPPLVAVDAVGKLESLGPSGVLPYLTALARHPKGPPIPDAAYYYDRPAPDDVILTPPVFDFHATLAAIGSYPVLQRLLGLVFDLTVPSPPGVSSGTTTVKVIPHFTSSFTGQTAPPPAGGSWSTRNASPPTSCQLGFAYFRATPLGSSDYVNGMLDLADKSRFAVTELDVDGAALHLNGLSQDLQNLSDFESTNGPTVGATMAVSLPALRSVGPTVVRTGWQSALSMLTARQTKNDKALQAWLARTPGVALPTFFAEDLVRGHRIDVYTASDPAPAWYSLFERFGSYTVGTDAQSISQRDEGFVVPAVSKGAGPTAPPDLYVHEAMARWSGWSLAAPRVGSHLAPDDSVSPNEGNPPPPVPASGPRTPPLSASFTVVPGSLPRLRFGHQYRFRARGVDLAGNGPQLMSTDASTATDLVTYQRYQPVAAPMLVSTGPYSPAQGTLLMALLNYSDTNPPDPVGRWLFPPKVAQLLAEEHGMFDGFVPGAPPDPSQPPTEAAYQAIIGRDAKTVADVDGVLFDSVTNQAPYLPVAQASTPWFPDPLSLGTALLGLPGDGSVPTVRPWGNGVWPDYDPLLIELQAGPVASHGYQPDGPGSSATETVALPPAAVLDVHVSSALSTPANPGSWESVLGVWQWIAAGSPATQAHFVALGGRGQLWLLSPYVTLRMVHAVRLPLFRSAFTSPQVSPRLPGATTATITDTAFAVHRPSTASVDVTATWTDPLDDPTDSTNDPRVATVTSNGHAFTLTVPDPAPLGAKDAPWTVVAPPAPFALDGSPGAVHDLGDTKFHRVTYTVTGTSRFAEFFRQEESITFADNQPVRVSNLNRGLDPGSVHLVDGAGNELDDSQFSAEASGTISLEDDSYLGQPLTVSFEPNVTTAPTSSAIVPILSSARPAPPSIARVAPAWQLSGPSGAAKTGIKYERYGGFLRVYLNRPWFSSGAGEILGVVALPDRETNYAPPADASVQLVTLMGLDPISLADPSLTVPSTPQNFAHLADVPLVPGRPAYNKTPFLGLAEAPTVPYTIYPYAVTYDPVAGQWYSDVYLGFPPGDVPPPGYFVRLALVRFQPYSFPGAEVSHVALATFAQPVSSRAVSIVQSGSSLHVSVTGPGYQGYRPASVPGENPGVVDDIINQYAPGPYSHGGFGASKVTSAMVVELQHQDTSLGFTGDLAWRSLSGSAAVFLTPAFSGAYVTWSGSVALPAPNSRGQRPPLRVRISEIDYPTGLPPGSSIDTTLRRPFVAHIPI